MWLKCGLVKNAGEEALKAKDRGMLEELREKATEAGKVEITRMINMLKK